MYNLISYVQLRAATLNGSCGALLGFYTFINEYISYTHLQQNKKSLTKL